MTSLAIITARGGSKRIPHKNILNFCGKPIIAYSIEAALASGLFDEVMVSTDDKEIAEISLQYGAAVPFLRSAETSNDYATTVEVLNEVLNRYAEEGKEPDWFCCLYPTAPFVTSNKLRTARQLMNDGADSVMVVAEFSYPPQRGLIEDHGILRYWFPEFKNTRSQDIPTVFHDCGQFYMATSDVFRSTGSLIGPAFTGLVVPQTEVQDIDNPSDWAMAEMKYRLMLDGGKAAIV